MESNFFEFKDEDFNGGVIEFIANEDVSFKVLNCEGREHKEYGKILNLDCQIVSGIHTGSNYSFKFFLTGTGSGRRQFAEFLSLWLKKEEIIEMAKQPSNIISFLTAKEFIASFKAISINKNGKSAQYVKSFKKIEKHEAPKIEGDIQF